MSPPALNNLPKITLVFNLWSLGFDVGTTPLLKKTKSARGQDQPLPDPSIHSLSAIADDGSGTWFGWPFGWESGIFKTEAFPVCGGRDSPQELWCCSFWPKAVKNIQILGGWRNILGQGRVANNSYVLSPENTGFSGGQNTSRRLRATCPVLWRWELGQELLQRWA